MHNIHRDLHRLCRNVACTDKFVRLRAAFGEEHLPREGYPILYLSYGVLRYAISQQKLGTINAPAPLRFRGKILHQVHSQLKESLKLSLRVESFTSPFLVWQSV